MAMTNRLLGPCALLLIAFWAPAALTQIVAPVNSARLSPIPDKAVEDADIKPFELGQTTIDFSTLTPAQRAELLRLLAAAPSELKLSAWNGEGASADPSALTIDQRRIAIDPAQTDGIWWFEYVNEGRSARRARWQLSRLPFPQVLSNWRTPPGLVAQGEIADVQRGNEPNRFKLQIGNFLYGVYPSQLDLARSPGQTVTSMLHSQFPAGKLYLRVLALGRSSSPVAWPSNSVEIEVQAIAAQVGNAEGMPTIVGTPTFNPARVADADQQCRFIATRAFDLPGAALPGQTVPGPSRSLTAGQSVNACVPPPDGLLGNFEAFQGSAVDIDSLINNWDGERYKHARDEAHEAVFRNFGGPEGGCNSHCRQALGLALDRGVAAVGIPAGSSQPDPVVNSASEFLRYLLVDALRISDLPAVVHEQASSRAMTAFRNAMLSPSHDSPPPFEPDPAGIGEPARLTLTLAARDSESLPAELQVREINRTSRVHSVLIPVPSIPAGQQITLPLRLYSTEIPDHSAVSALDSVALLTADVSDASALLQRAAEQMRDAQEAHAELAKRQLRGNYDFELAWRSADGTVIQAMRLRCKARSGDCRVR